MKLPGDRRTRERETAFLPHSSSQSLTHIFLISHTLGDARAQGFWANLGLTPVNPGREIVSYLVARGPRS